MFFQVGYRSNLKSSQSIQDLSMHGVYNDTRLKPANKSRSVQQGNEIDTSTFTRRPRNKNRPVSLNLSHLTATPYDSGCKSMDTSLTGSPVNGPGSPKSLGPDLTSNITNNRTTNRHKRYSCSFYVDIDEKEVDVGRESKSYDDLSEIGKNCDNVFLGDKSDPSDLSSDSLEECSEYQAKPRRCISEYQILERSSSAFGFKGTTRFEKTKFHSEENILADEDENWDRHSSASFFLRRNTCRSTESILTDESEYQFLFSNRDVFHSTESILTDAGDFKEEELDQIPQKQPVIRTRSLQDTTVKSCNIYQASKSRPDTPIEEDWPVKEQSHEKVKHETFFIPLGNGPIKPKIPEALLKKHLNREEKKHASGNHPVVAHKPPKPKIPPAARPMAKPMKFSLAMSSIAGKAPKSLPFKKEFLAPVKDQGLNSIGDIPPFNGGRVKLLSQNFERISGREEMSCDSGSSTPGTSSSCANSPKRKWKPSIGNQLARRIANGQFLPDKCSAGTITKHSLKTALLSTLVVFGRSLSLIFVNFVSFLG